MAELSILNGLAGGLVATIVMTAFMLTLGDDSPPPTALFWSKYVGDGEPEEYMPQRMTLHMMYGIIAGAVFVVAVPLTGLTVGSMTTGVLFGLAYGFVLFLGAAVFMAFWPWNVLDADDSGLRSTVELADDPAWRADESPCLGPYPEDVYTPSGTAEDGGWPLCEASADVARWQTGLDDDAVADHVTDHAAEWTTTAGLLPERVDGDGGVAWNSTLQWSQAMYVLLVESHRRGEPYGLAPVE